MRLRRSSSCIAKGNSFRLRKSQENFMATAAVSSSSLQQVLQSFLQQRGTDLQQLSRALEHGDLASAQSAFSALQSLAQNGPFSDSHAFNLTRRQQEFAAVGRALQNGNLAGAQRAFAELRGNRASDPPGADGSQPLPPAAVIEISVQAAAAADAAATTTADASADTTTSGAAASDPAPNTAASAPLAPTAGAATPAPEIVINLSLGNGSTGGIEIDFTASNPAAPPVSPAPSNASASGSATTTSASPAVSAGTSAAANPSPEIVVNLTPTRWPLVPRSPLD
jgi:hypothetical protein